MVINKNVKDNKHSQNWTNNMKWLASSLGKDKQTQFITHLDDQAKLVTEKNQIETEIQNLESQKKGLKNIVANHREANKKLTELETNYATSPKNPDKFLNNGANEYDWWTKSKNYFPTTYADNLYQGTVGGTNLKITEQEAIKLLTRAIKAFEKINQTKFGTKFTASTHTSGTNHLPEIQKLATDGLKDNQIIGKDAQGNDLPDKGKPSNHRWLDRLEYSFKSQFVQDADIQKDPSGTAFTPQSAETITKAKVDNFFAFLDDISKNGTIKPEFLTELQSDADILKDIENNIAWKILPAQNTPFSESKNSKWKLEDGGIKADNTKTKLYLNEIDLNKVVKFQITEGLKSWIELVQAFFPNGNSQRTKLASAFQADPYEQLLTDISSNTYSTNWEMPEDKDSLQEIVDELETDKLAVAAKTNILIDKIDTKTGEKKTKEQAITAKDTELEKDIKEILTKKREELTQKNYKELNGDNRKTWQELYQIQNLLLQIRYLENDGDTTLNSSVGEENTTLTEIEERLPKSLFFQSYSNHSLNVDLKTWLVAYFINNLAQEDGKKDDWTHAISQIKDWKAIRFDLNEYLDNFKEYEKLFKLDAREAAAKKAIEDALAKKDDKPETLTDWQTKLKELDPLLTETIITQKVMEDWKTQTNFSKLDQVGTELNKVFKDKVLDADFAKLMKKEDAEITDIAKLFQKKNAQEIITLIEYFEYEQLAEADKEKKKQQIWWTLEKKDPQDDKKYLDSGEPTEKEIKDILYQVVTGKKTLLTEKKADETTAPPYVPSDDNKEMSAIKEWLGFGSIGKSIIAYFGILLLIGGVLAAIFWKNISEWLNGPEEPSEKKDQVDISDDDEE